jgi:hypothetical protein
VDLGSLYPGQPPEFQVEERVNGIEVTMILPGFHAAAITRQGEHFQQLTIPQCGFRGEPGSPQMPFKHFMIHVPHGVKFSYEVTTGEPVVAMRQVMVFPHQPPELDCGQQKAAFFWDRASYEKNRNVPLTPVRMTLDGVIRGTRVIGFEVSPLQYNPEQKEVSALTSLRLNITFEGKPDMAKNARAEARANPFFDSCLESFLINGGPIRSDKVSYSKNGMVEYLIIAADEFLEEIEPLAVWKERKGFHVSVVGTSTTGSTAEEIQDYIQGLYDTTPELTYVLLVGDHPQIPGYPVSPDAYGNAFVSDLPYTLVDGTDYFPDLVLGRISVSSEVQCSTVVAKILAYDRTPTPADWYNQFLMAGYLQDYDDYNCRADRWFFETSTHVLHFMEGTVGAGIYTAATSDSMSCDPYRYRSDSYPHRPPLPDPVDFTVPAGDAALFTSEAASTQDVIDAINTGVALVQHRDHGGEYGWGDPPFDTANINMDLTNGSKTPVVFSINCLTGKFDHSGTCFAEVFLRKAEGGCVGIIAATEVSYSGYNDLLTHGMYDSFWNDYDTDDGGNSYAHSWRPAEALMYGKYYMYYWEGDSDATLYEHRLFQWFGDPEMMLRLGEQISPVVDHVPTIPVGLDEVTVECSAEGARVAVSENGVLLGRGIVTGGAVTVYLNPAPIQPTTLDVVVTGQNLLPYEGTITVEWNACDNIPGVVTEPATAVGGTAARLNGTGNPQGCNAIGYFEYGTVSGSYSDVTSTTYLGTVVTDVAFVTDLAGLTPATTYYYRAVVETGWGAVFGDEVSFSTLDPIILQPPILQTPSPGQVDLEPTAVTVSWLDTNSSPDDMGYEVRYRRANSETYDHLTVGASVQSADLPVLRGNTTYCWNVRAVGDQNLTFDSPWAESTDWEFVTGGEDVLILNGDSGTDYSSYFTAPVQAAGYTYNVFLRSSSNPVTHDLLNQYPAVVWTTGDDFGSGSNMNSAEEAALRNYLDSGGALYLSSQDYIYSLVGGVTGTTQPNSFLRDYLGVDWFDSDVDDFSAVTGVAGFSALSADLNQSTPMSSYFDEITPTSAAAPIFGITGTVDIAGVYTTKAAVRSVFTVFPFENIVDEADRDEIMQAILDHLLTFVPELIPPEMSAPADGAVDQATSLQLEWIDTNSSPNEAGFEIRYKRASDPDYTILAAGSDSTFCLLDGLDVGTEYFWNLRATGDGSAATDSTWANAGSDWSFITAALPMLDAPVLLSPVNGAANQPPDITLSWTDTNNAPNETGCEIRIRISGDATYTYHSVNADQTEWVLPDCPFETTYEWNVRALGDNITYMSSAWFNGGTDWSFARGVAGDVNEDGAVDSQDLVMLAGYLAGNLASGDLCTWNGDCDGDGKADSVDLAELLRGLNQP